MPEHDAVAAVLAEGLGAKIFSAAVVAVHSVGTGGPRRWVLPKGTTDLLGTAPVTDETLFDIASLTKPFVASAALRLVEQRVLALDMPLASVLFELDSQPQGAATLEQLLAHEAGFAAWLPLFESMPTNLRGTAQGKQTITQGALEAEALGRPGTATVYSDLGFIALAELLERTTGESLDILVAAEVTTPLQLMRVHYRPPPLAADAAQCAGIAATERCPWRGRLLVGEVHDDNAWAGGGVAGHAGLFATAGDVAALGAAWLEALAGHGWLFAPLAARAIARRPLGRALGWDTKDETASSAGARMSQYTFGHLGYTGCSLWVDPDRGLSVALLTNRVHFGRQNDGLRTLRPRLYDAVVASFEEWGKDEKSEG